MKFRRSHVSWVGIGVLLAVLVLTGSHLVSLRRNFSFDLAPRLAQQDAAIASLGRYCRKNAGRWCFESLAAGVAWNSQFTSSDLYALQAGCSGGDARACSAFNDYTRANQTADNIWMSHQTTKVVTQSDTLRWPRVVFLPEKTSYRQWLDISYQALTVRGSPRADVICGGSREFSDALVCVSFGAVAMNLALRRVSYVVEQGGHIPHTTEHQLSPTLKFWQGHDIKRPDFESAVQKIRDAGSVQPEEQALWSFLLAKPWNFVLTFSAFSVFSAIPSHEFLHGIYFSSEQYRQKVANLVSSSPLKTLPLRWFVDSLYKTENDYVILNEMHAYALQRYSVYNQEQHWLEASQYLRDGLSDILRREPAWSDVTTEVLR